MGLCIRSMAWLGVTVGNVPVDLTLVAKPSMTDSVLPDSDSNRRSTASASAKASVAESSVVDMVVPLVVPMLRGGEGMVMNRSMIFCQELKPSKLDLVPFFATFDECCIDNRAVLFAPLSTKVTRVCVHVSGRVRAPCCSFATMRRPGA